MSLSHLVFVFEDADLAQEIPGACYDGRVLR